MFGYITIFDMCRALTLVLRKQHNKRVTDLSGILGYCEHCVHSEHSEHLQAILVDNEHYTINNFTC